jgi:hypothetical protein
MFNDLEPSTMPTWGRDSLATSFQQVGPFLGITGG